MNERAAMKEKIVDFDFDEGFDPLNDIEDSEEIEELEIEGLGTFTLPSEEQMKQAIEAARVDETNMTPAERIDHMLNYMSGRRHILLEVIHFCEEPQEVSKVEAMIDEFQANNASVYSAATLCLKLKEVGALELLDGEPVEPRIVEDDGVEYLEVVKAPEGKWVSTTDGLAVFLRDEPFDQLCEMFDENPEYRSIYERVLEFCTESSHSIEEIAELLVDEPLMEKPRRHANWFVERLEAYGALVWQRNWVTTSLGQKVLEA